MSSFRIDRQYVSFQTAETQPVYAATQTQSVKKEVRDVAEPSGIDISKLYNEIYERLLNEHAEQAESMLSRASAEAQEIVEKAKQQAEEMTSRARAEAERLKNEMTVTLESAYREKISRERQELQNMELSLRSSYDSMIDGIQGEVIGLVMEIVRKVIGIKMSQTDEIFLGLVRDALERLKQTGSVVIRVGPEDYMRYFGGEDGPELDTGELKTTVVEEPDFSPGDLIVESEGEIIDLSVGRQLNQIEKAFQN